jgi:hypothetical protein
MNKLVLCAVCLVLAVSGVSFGQGNGLISGVASVDGKPLPNITVRLRNVDNGQLISNTTASASGEFSFPGLSPANYIVEMVSANGTMIGTSVGVTLSAATMVVTNVSVGASAASVAASTGIAAGAGAVAGGAAGTGAAGLSATVVAVSAVGATLGTTAVVVVANDASPSR